MDVAVVLEDALVGVVEAEREDDSEKQSEEHERAGDEDRGQGRAPRLGVLILDGDQLSLLPVREERTKEDEEDGDYSQQGHVVGQGELGLVAAELDQARNVLPVLDIVEQLL